MVKFNRSKDSDSSKKPKNNRRKLNISFCAELELDKRNTIKIRSNDESLKRMDPSVLYVHSTNILTRYEKDELIALKDSRQSQAPPACMYAPHIIRLNILKFSSDHSQSYEKECEGFREKLHNLSLTSFDPKFLELLSNFNSGLFNVAANPNPAPENVSIPNLANIIPQLPNFINNNRRMFFQQPMPPQPNQQPQRRHVSWNNQVDEKIIETRQDNYQNGNRRSNFFDNITSSAADNQNRQFMGRNNMFQGQGSGKFRGPMGQNPSYNRNFNNNNNYNRVFYQPKRCELNPISQNSSGTSVDDRKEISTDSSKRTDDSVKKDDTHGLLDGHVADDEEDGEEPEWLYEPVTRLDTIELRGFDDDVCSTTTNNDDDDSERNGQAPIAKLKPPARSTPTKKREIKRAVNGSMEFCFDDFSNPRASYDGQSGQYSNRKMHQNARYPQWFNGNGVQRNSNGNGGNLNKSSTTSSSSLNSSMNRSNSSFYQGQNNNHNQNTNKFFNMWQQQQRPNPLNVAANNENVNYLNHLQLQQHQQQNVLNIAEIENKIKQNNNLFTLLSQIKQNQYQNPTPARRSDFDMFLDKIAKNGATNNNAQRMNSSYPPAGNFGNVQQGFNGQPNNPMPQMSVNSFLESYRHAQQQQAANNAPRFPMPQRNDFKVPSAPTPEELIVHTQNIMRNAIIRKQNEKSEKQ